MAGVPEKMWVPADRFLAVIDRKRPSVGKQNVDGRRLSELRSGRQKFVGMGTADRLLVRFGLEEWWHIPKEQGGLADIYEDGAQYGSPAWRMPVPQPAYATEAERVEARRRSGREYYARKKERRAA